MFGPFSAGDSLRVYRLQRKGVSLDLQRTLTQPVTPLREAWLSFVTQQAMGRPTFVLSDLQDGEGFIQVRYRPHQAAADVAFLAPEFSVSERVASAWSHLLEGAGIEAAGRGIQRIFAGLPEAGTEIDVFQQAGFTPYAGEDVYCLANQRAEQSVDGLPDLRLQRADDWPALQRLCVALTPQRVRQAEGGIAAALRGERHCRQYVLPGENGNDLAAAVSICAGGQAHWLRILAHPDAGHLTDDLVRWGTSALGNHSARPVYCNVRQYESGVWPALESAGFEPFATRTLLVKHTVAMLKSSAPDLVPALARTAEPVPPAYHINGEPEFLAAEHEA